MLPFRRLTAFSVSLVLCACVGITPSPSSSPAPSRAVATPLATTVALASAAPSAAATAVPAATPAPTPNPLDALEHCGGTPAPEGMGRSVERGSTWAGYVAANPPGRFSCVEAGWIEPLVTCGSGPSEVAIWVGIGGYTSVDLGIFDDQRALEMAGTGVECEDGVADHYAWHQVEPREPSDLLFEPTTDEPIEMALEPGDRVWAQVRYADGAYRMTVANLTRALVRSIVVTGAGSHRSSADWVVAGEEDDPMAEFTRVTFTGAQATMSGILGTAGSSSWVRNEVDEWAGGQRRLRVSELSPDGDSFRVAWLHR